jgi:cytochrome c556
MMLSRFSLALLSAALLSSCQAANTIVQEPFKLLGDVFSSVGRATGTGGGAANDRKPGDASIEAAEAEQAKAQLAEQSAKPATEDATAAVVAR